MSLQKMPIQHADRRPGVLLVSEGNIRTDRAVPLPGMPAVAVDDHLGNAPVLSEVLSFAEEFFRCPGTCGAEGGLGTGSVEVSRKWWKRVQGDG